MLEEKSSIKIMKRSAIREAAFKLIYSFEIQKPENLEEQIDLYLECEEITDKEIGEEVKKVRDFINFSDFKVINNVKISDTKDLAVIIKDKYKLFGMQVSKENFQEDNLEDLIKKVKIVSNYNNIKKSKYSIDDLEYIVSVKEMLKK